MVKFHDIGNWYENVLFINGRDTKLYNKILDTIHSILAI